MAVGQGFSKVATSGSVFHYDTGDVINSFKGKPTTNLLLDIGYTYGTQNQPYFKSSYGTEYDIIPGLGGPVLVNYCNFFNDYNGGSGNCCPSVFYFGNFTVSPSTIYTYQLIYKTPDGYANANYMYHYEFGPGGYVTEYGLWSDTRTQDLGNGWVHAWGTFTSNAATNYFQTYLFHYQYTQTKIQIAGVMLTQGDVIIPPRQFISVNTTRSNTQGLLDLTSNYTVNLANISFNSLGMLAFDGTNDYINISPFSLNPNTNGFTYETILNSAITNPSYSTWKNLVGMGGGSNVYGILVEADTRGYRLDVPDTSGNRIGVTTGINIPANTNIHIVWSWENGVFKFYENGVLQVNSNQGAYSAPNITGIAFGTGINVSNGYWNGNQFVNKIYNRALTAGEVTQNYNHYKTRFNLP
jgi:hypothetical protein